MKADGPDPIRSNTARAGAYAATKPAAGTVGLGPGTHSSGSHPSGTVILIMREWASQAGHGAELPRPQSSQTRTEHD